MKKVNGWKNVCALVMLLSGACLAGAEVATAVQLAFDNVVGQDTSAVVFSSGNVGPYPDALGSTPQGVIGTNVVQMSRSAVGAYVINLYDNADFVRLGEWLAPPPGTLADATHPPIIVPGNYEAARYVASQGKILALAQGPVTIEWWDISTQQYVAYTYVIAQLSHQEPVSIFHTEGSAQGPLVDGSSIPAHLEMVVHPNEIITTNELWLDEGHQLHATGKTGLAMLLFEDKNTGEIVDREVVEVRLYAPTVANGSVEVGSWLAPSISHPNLSAYPHVSLGKQGSYPYLYQHDTAVDTSYYGGLLAVAANGIAANIEVFWTRKAFHDIEWPYEMRRYTTHWPTPGVDPVWMSHTEGPNLGPTIDLSSLSGQNLEMTLYANETVTTNSIWIDQSTNLHATGETGFVTLLFRNSSGYMVGPEIIEVRAHNSTVAAGNVEVGTWLDPYSTHPTQCIYPYVANGKQGLYPYIYQHDTVADTNYYGRLLAVAANSEPDEMEVCWMREGLYAIQWPYEMRQYTVDWPAKGSVSMYETEMAGSGRAPTVPTPVGYNVFIHTNSEMKNALFVNPDNHFHADLSGVSGEGMVTIHYEDAAHYFVGREVVELRYYTPETIRLVDIGSQLQPVIQKTNSPARHHIAAGKMTSKSDNTGYIWQHLDTGNAGSYDGAMFATKENSQPVEMEVFWLEKGLLEVEWPYEMDRYRADWPAIAQRYVRRQDHSLPKIALPPELNAVPMPSEKYDDPTHHGYLVNQVFYTDGPGYSLLNYETGSEMTRDWVGFQVVESVWHDDAALFDLTPTNWIIGVEITNETHEGVASGYIYEHADDPQDDRYHPAIYGAADPLGWTTGQVFAVNKGLLEVWWSTQTHTNWSTGIQWPAQVKVYTNRWPTNASPIVIASQLGTGPITNDNWNLYSQNDPNLPGFNPNDEHALVRLANGGVGQVIFALRDDLGMPGTSEPFVLMSYDDPAHFSYKRIQVYQVLATNEQYAFAYTGTAGTKIQPPYPLTTLALCEENAGVSGPYWRDRKTEFWSKAAGDDGGSEQVVMRYFYPNQESLAFYFPSNPPAFGTSIPWLDWRASTPGTPIDIYYSIDWPFPVPELRLSETLVQAKNGLPGIYGWVSGEILYQQAAALGQGSSVQLVDPFVTRAISLDTLPDDVETVSQNGVVRFPQLPAHLKQRLSYNPLSEELKFKGVFIEPPLGEYYLLPNVITDREKTILQSLSQDALFNQKLEELFATCSQIDEVVPNTPFEALALTAGHADEVGYVTLVENNSTNLNQVGDPIALHILQVSAPLYQGELKVVESDNIFDETLVLRHSGDFAGEADEYVFEWKTLPPDPDGSAPSAAPEDWVEIDSDPSNGEGALDLSIEPGKVSPLLLMSDNYFIARYRSIHESHPYSTNWSTWTGPQLAEGWIKRVMNRINPYEQRFNDYATHEVNTMVSMIAQAGGRYVGPVALNPEIVDEIGLIEFYATILKRGGGMSIAGTPPINYGPANDALLLAAGRLADLYMLLGNEAYADAADPTIGFGTEDGIYGSEASSLHCFMNQTASLLEEELKLLRGRDDSLLPAVQTDPVYNRMVWNYSSGLDGGEVAYSLNYQIEDQNINGVIDEADAKIMYPQGHGDSWGHYLTASKGYYQLLQNPYFTWEPRTEAVLVGGAPLEIDYLDERKFARVAAAKAKTGAEIVNLSYRNFYEEDPAGQWQGYKDVDTNRAWGVSGWAMRSGQSAFCDWVTGNSLLPEASTNTGIQKIDRTTVLELREVVSAYQAIQQEMDQADAGLNPVGLAKHVVPFDISPSEIDAGKTHFEQIYERAVQLMNNAIAVFDHAQNSSQLLRRQANHLDDFQQTVQDREVDFKNRLLEVFGYPYEADIGPGKTYETGYDGPDLYHYMYVDPLELVGQNYSALESMVTVQVTRVESDGSLIQENTVVPFHFSKQGFGLVKPPVWSDSMRRAPGEIQRARSDLIQARIRFEQSRTGYRNLLDQIEDQASLLQAQQQLNADEIQILNAGKNRQETLNKRITHSRAQQQRFRTQARMATIIANAVGEASPENFGVIGGFAAGIIGDWTSFIRSAIQLAGTVITESMTQQADRQALVELSHQQAKEMAQSASSIRVTALRGGFAIEQQLAQLEQLIRQEVVLRLGLFTEEETLNQLGGNYLAVLARGQRLLEERERFRKQTAADIQAYRYKDMAFRIFRNDALQKYRAQFDLAARYVYLAAKAYDYETNLRNPIWMNEILQARSIGKIVNGTPLTGGHDAGLADPMARLHENWIVLEGQLGFNNPQTETGRFSLRYELFRIMNGYQSGSIWKETLSRYVVDDLLTLPFFQEYCIPFSPAEATEPAIVIPFSTMINFGQNFFGWPHGGGDNTYNSTYFATKVRSVGIWFSNYNNLQSSGLVNTPHAYLIPVGNDVMRVPDGSGDTREWEIVDQKIPVPYSSPTDIADPEWLPSDNLHGTFASTRRFPMMRAYHDSGGFSPSEAINNSRLIGRSVWNTKWLLVIPAGALHSDREEAINTFIYGPINPGNGERTGYGVQDIKIFFQTYSYHGEVE